MLRRFISSLVLATMCLSAAPLSVGASFNPFENACDGNTSSAVICQTDKKSDGIVAQGPKALLLKITDVVAYIAGALAVILIIVGAIQFITSGSDVSTGARHDADVENARRTIGNALIGIVVIVLAKTLIAFVVSKF